MGWKDILRPIRDRLRDNLPQPDRDEGEENKRKRLEQRSQDRLRGFIYLESFDELDQWRSDQVEPHQRANVPLLRRPECCKTVDRSKSSVTLIHDYSGNYHDYEDIQPVPVDQKSYACSYLQYVDRFVYFSHKLVCVPPPTWTNTMHRNGIKSLGTFLVEPQFAGIERILERSEDGRGNASYPVADQLIKMAKTCGFDGYLINLEKTFPIFKWNLLHLIGFLTQLRLALGEGNVIWYDALDIENSINYQNGVTDLNVGLAQAAGAIITNYKWTPELVQSSQELALSYGLKPCNVIFGVDIWAQNTSFDGPRRKTWPYPGGGGTGTGRAVAKLAEHGVSSGLFAPAWSYEHFSSKQEAIEKTMWTGEPLPEVIACACQPSGVHDVSFYKDFPVLRSALEAPAGSKSFFYTDFSPAFRHHDGGNTAQLGSQSVLPHRFASEHQDPLAFETGSGGSLQVQLDTDLIKSSVVRSVHERRIFSLHMHDARTLEARICFSKQETPSHMQVKIVMNGTGMSWKVPQQSIERTTIVLPLVEPGSRVLASEGLVLTGLTVVVEMSRGSDGSTANPTTVLELHTICIWSRGELDHDKHYDIRDLKHEPLQGSGRTDLILSWSLSFSPTDGRAVPCSTVTGPFEHFDVMSDGLFSLRLNACQARLSRELQDKLDERPNAVIAVNGYGFDGTLLCQRQAVWRDMMEHAGDWHMVDRPVKPPK